MEETQSLNQIKHVLDNLYREHDTYNHQFELEQRELNELELQLNSLREVNFIEIDLSSPKNIKNKGTLKAKPRIA